MKLSNLFFVFIFLPFFMLGQNQITGTIVDENNQPIPADIYIPDLGRGTIANFDGEFQLDRIPNGNHEIIFSYLGYSSTSKRIRFPREADNQLHIILKFSSVEMDPVILSIPFHQLQKDNVMKVEQIRISDLQKSGAVNLSDGISNMSGVNTINTGVGIGKPVIRGLSSNRVLTYSQDVRLENQQFGEEHGLGINESGIESVEVIKGPASLLYGSDALGGVLYLNPERFAATDSFAADANASLYSNTKGSNINLGVKNTVDKFGFLARGAFSQHSDYKTGNGKRATNSRFQEKDFKTGAQYKTEKITSALRYNYNHSDLGISEEIGNQTTSKSMELPYQEVTTNILSWSNTLRFDKSKVTANLGYISNDRKEFEDEHEHDHDTTETHEEGEPNLRLKLNTLNYDVKYHLPSTEKLETILGAQGMYQTNKNTGEEILIPDATTNDIGVFATGHYHLDALDFQAGVRFDNREINIKETWDAHNQELTDAASRSFTSLNAALGVKWDMLHNLVGRLNLASGFRAPNLAELTSDGVHHGTFRYEVGDLDLKNEQNLQIDLSLEMTLSNVELFANGFYNTVKDYIYLDPTNEFMEEVPVYRYKQNNAELYGGEFGFHYHPKGADWLHFDNMYEMVIGKQKNGDYLPFIPAHTLSNRMQVFFKNGKTFENTTAFVQLKTSFAQNKLSEFETQTGGYSLLNLGASTAFDWNNARIDFGVSVTNLLDKEYTSHLSRLKEQRIPDIGRNIIGTIKVQL
ncbi:MAG TPA: TonB-dependent receptor [Flavobacteriaceae bacterium]|nr:TonB-dependent receptor [Flavobacteriaceae bacterium]